MPEHLKEYVVELADRFPDLPDADVIQAAIDFFPGAVAYRTAVVKLYDQEVAAP